MIHPTITRGCRGRASRGLLGLGLFIGLCSVPAGADLERLALAAELIDYARQSESAAAMWVAAQMMRELGVREDASRFGAKRSVAGAPEGAAPKAPGLGPRAMLPQVLLGEAKAFAADDPGLLALIERDALRATPVARRSGGARCTADTVRPGARDRWPLEIASGRSAEVLVAGDGDTNLDCAVLDPAETVVAEDRRLVGICDLRWRAESGGPFTVEIDNGAGAVANHYRLCAD